MAGSLLWLDAADRATLFDATSGGSTVADNGAIARWEDKSGNGKHFTQGIANNRPIIIPSGLNGRPAIEFDNTNDSLARSDAGWFSDSQETTIFLVSRTPTAAGAYASLFAFLIGANRWAFLNSTASGYTDYVVGTTNTNIRWTAVGSSRNTAHITSIRYNGAGFTSASNYSIRQNQTQASPTSSTTWGFSNNTAGTSIGASTTASGSTQAELIIYNRRLSDAENAAIESYLSAKWGI